MGAYTAIHKYACVQLNVMEIFEFPLFVEHVRDNYAHESNFTSLLIYTFELKQQFSR
jgi:hypothetical protein